jgi:hypothetical protein
MRGEIIEGGNPSLLFRADGFAVIPERGGRGAGEGERTKPPSPKF